MFSQRFFRFLKEGGFSLIINKLRFFFSYYILGRFGIALLPKNISLVINNVCNARCKMCDIGQRNIDSQFFKNLAIDEKENKEIPLQKIFLLIDEIKSFKPQISIVGTEPLLYKSLIPLSEYIIKNGLKLKIGTNGILLPNYAEDLVKTEIHYLWVSLDGPPSIHNEIRGIPFAFEKAVEGIKLINYFKNKFNKKFPEIFINFTISNYNYHSLVDFLKEIKNLNLNIKSIEFGHLNFVTHQMAEKHNKTYGKILGKATETCLSAIDIKKIDFDILFEQIKKIKKEFFSYCFFTPNLISKEELIDYYYYPFKRMGKKYCVGLWSGIDIMVDGRLLPSTRCFDIDLGNISDGNFKKVWNGEKMKKVRKLMKKNGLFPACLRCCASL